MVENTHMHTHLHTETPTLLNSRSMKRVQQQQRYLGARNALLTLQYNFIVHLLLKPVAWIRTSLFDLRADSRRQELVSPSTGEEAGFEPGCLNPDSMVFIICD